MAKIDLILLVSFFSTDFARLKNRWKRESTGLILPTDFHSISPSEQIGKQTGVVQLLDWSSKDIIGSQELSGSPTGICVNGRSAFVCRYFDIVELDRNLKPGRVISSRLMNDLHSIEITNNGLLLASSGIDAALECDQEGEVNYVWSAADHGFETDCFGRKRTMDRFGDYRSVELHTRCHSTHLNSCHLTAERLYATLFHHGTVVAVDKLTGAIKRTLPGLIRPHSVRDAGPDTLLISNTCCGRVVFTDYDLMVKFEIGVSSGWVQDAILVAERDFVLVSDNDSHCLRLIEVTTGHQVDSWSFDPNWRVFGVADASAWD